MSAEIFFIYDSHCPWSYAASPLLAEIAKARNDITIHTLHCAYYHGDNAVDAAKLKDIESLSTVTFSDAYKQQCEQRQDSTLIANLMSWVEQKAQGKALNLLANLQEQHFKHGNALSSEQDVKPTIDTLKLSPPAKSLRASKLCKEAEYAIGDIDEIQQIIGTQAIPALLLAVDDELILLNHNLYIGQPKKIVDAIAIELGE
ncbi:thioredoxin domain-containing protein [Thalassotalea hakodatensis]|uniref:hypothetical protein n=1 Tax=Thalassotalea hakodatensis TaxID=3030492 RepID=UPI002572D13D|nr:hypothetical protein [Thalassotalea hakodatensis]